MDQENKLEKKIQKHTKFLIECGYAAEDARYLAESKILPRYFITPVTDLKLDVELKLRKEAALQILAEHKSIRAVTIGLGITRKTWGRWCSDDKEFAQCVADVVAEWGDELEEEAFRRMLDSDQILLTMLKAYRPERYRETSRVELTGKDGGPIRQQITSAKLSLKAKFKSIAERRARADEILEGSAEDVPPQATEALNAATGQPGKES